MTFRGLRGRISHGFNFGLLESPRAEANEQRQIGIWEYRVAQIDNTMKELTEDWKWDRSQDIKAGTHSTLLIFRSATQKLLEFFRKFWNSWRILLFVRHQTSIFENTTFRSCCHDHQSVSAEEDRRTVHQTWLPRYFAWNAERGCLSTMHFIKLNHSCFCDNHPVNFSSNDLTNCFSSTGHQVTNYSIVKLSSHLHSVVEHKASIDPPSRQVFQVIESSPRSPLPPPASVNLITTTSLIIATETATIVTTVATHSHITNARPETNNGARLPWIPWTFGLKIEFWDVTLWDNVFKYFE